MTSYSFYTYAPDIMVYDEVSGTFTLSASFDPDTDRNLVEYTDDDASFDGDVNGDLVGDDATQVGTVYDSEGNVIGSGTVYVPDFLRITGPDGTEYDLDQIMVDGVLVGYISTEPLIPGTVYTYGWSSPVEEESVVGHDYYSDHSVPCFDAETLISTPEGLRRAVEILPGHEVITVDNGVQTVRWRCERRVDLTSVAEENLPVLIPKGALGAGRPANDLIVSPQHRVLLGHFSQGAQLAPAQMLVPAKALVGTVVGVRIMHGRKAARWVHFACSRHQIICANGAYVESLLLGSVCYDGLLPAQKKCLDLLAEQGLVDLEATPARMCLGASAASQMILSQRKRGGSKRRRKTTRFGGVLNGDKGRGLYSSADTG